MFGPTQEAQDLKKKPNYGYVVLMDLDADETRPFACFPRSMFNQTEIKDRWMESTLDDVSRTTKLALQRMQETSYSLFGKIELGKNIKRN